jgi:hypothetical protein
MLGLRGAVPIGTHIIANELELLWEDETLFQTQQEMICQTNMQLTLHVPQRSGKVDSMIHNVVDDDARIGLIVDQNPTQCSERLPLTIHIVDKADESGRSIGRLKRHNHISSFDSIGALKGKLLLTRFHYSKLMISQWGVK